MEAFARAPRVLPHLVSQRSSGEVRLAEVRLHHFEPGDPCEHRGRPEAVPIILTSLVLLTLPRLWGLISAQGAVPNGLQRNSAERTRTDSLDIYIYI